MIIKEVIEDEKSGDIIINVRARRGNKHYRLPYRIAHAKMSEIDLEHLKTRVRTDIDEREAEATKRELIVNKLGLQVGNKITLD